jgi:ATP-dependent protease ClpP protease subunit
MPDTDLDRAIEQLQRMRSPRSESRAWYEITNAADKKRTAKIRIYDEIGWWGTSARTFAQELDDLDVDEIDLRLNSPGGNAWDGLAIYNSLRAHPATVTVTVDGMAASAASYIAMAGDKVLMNRGSQMMIHDASGIVIGNASDMEKYAIALNKLSDSIASVYAARAGGSTAEWRDVMREEAWYKADEAVAAGLADEVVNDTGSDSEATARAPFDLTAYAYAYAGRDAAPAPRIPHRPQSQAPDPAPITAAEAARRIHAASTKTPDASSAAGSPNNPEGAAEMQFTDEERTALRARFNLSADAGDDAIKAALLAPPPTNPPAANPPKADGNPAPMPTAAPPGTMLVSDSVWQELQNQLMTLAAFVDQTKRNERDSVIDQAIRDGKFTPAQKPHFQALWDANPDGTRAVIDSMQRNTAFAVEAVGYANGEGDDFEREYQALVGNMAGRRR